MNRVAKLCLVVIAVSLMMIVAKGVFSTHDYMTELPVYNRFRCSICHTGPTQDASTLNQFGEDFRDNGYTWDNTLASMDSDGDTFDNGEELGDRDGDGSPEVNNERSNPGDQNDRPSSVDEKTWGLIKSLFED